MKKKLILIVLACLIVIGSTGVWALISEKEVAGNSSAKFFGTPRSYPTSGGEKMKVEW